MATNTTTTLSVGAELVYENWLTGTWANATVTAVHAANSRRVEHVDIRLEDGSPVHGVPSEMFEGNTGEGLRHDVEGVKLV